MAIRFGTLKLPFVGRDAAVAAPSPRSTGDAAPKAAPGARGPLLARPLPLIGHLPTGGQLKVLTSLLIGLLLVDGAIVAYDTRQSTFATA